MRPTRWRAGALREGDGSPNGVSQGGKAADFLPEAVREVVGGAHVVLQRAGLSPCVLVQVQQHYAGP